MDKLPIKAILNKAAVLVKGIANYNINKSNQTNERIKLAKNTQEQIISELKREDLSKDERKKLINALTSVTPNENTIQSIVRGTSVAKTGACIIGIVAVTYIIFNRKRQ